MERNVLQVALDFWRTVRRKHNRTFNLELPSHRLSLFYIIFNSAHWRFINPRRGLGIYNHSGFFSVHLDWKRRAILIADI